MSDLWREMTAEFPDEVADDQGSTEFVAFDHNIGRFTGATAKQFPDNLQLQFNLKVDESVRGNVGRTVSLRYPAAPQYIAWKDGQKSDVTDADEMKAIQKRWVAGLKKIIEVAGLSEPTGETLGNEFLAQAWAAACEGKPCVFAAKEDKKGYAQVKQFQMPDGKLALLISKPGAPAKDKKGLIPGLTRVDQARQAIQKANAKES